MLLPISYMGTKRRLAGHVAEIAEKSRPGSFLDLFSGMCSVAKAVGCARQIWTNDLQYFAEAVAKAHFCSRTSPPTRLDAVAIIYRNYSAHINKHMAIAAKRISDETAALNNLDPGALTELYISWNQDIRLPSVGDEAEKDATLFRDTFSGAYFGLSQAIEIDGIRFSIDQAKRERKIDSDTHRWMLLALGVALSKCASSTGHFAQPLTPKGNNIKKIVAQRRRSIWDGWIGAVEIMSPVGKTDWRKQNKTIRSDAIACLTKISKSRDESPAVVYADPPYTTDQYSRYYHVYETLIRYDYPAAIGRGLYRDDRVVSSFSLASKVESSMLGLIELCSHVEADLIMSYPANGLLKGSRDAVPTMIKRFYGREPEVFEFEHDHSTMGASKGAGKQRVVEVIYRAYH